MLTAADLFLIVNQYPETLYIFWLLLFLNFGISLGLLTGFLYSIRYLFKSLESVKSEELNQRFDDIVSQVKAVQEALHKIDVAEILEKITKLESKITSLEGRTALLERRLLRPFEPKPPSILQPRPSPEEEPPALAKLSDIILVAPDVKFAGVITSQGFLVESYGSCSEEPARLLEIVRLHGTLATSIVKGRSRFEIFHLGDVKDISIYGILEFRDGVNAQEQSVSRTKKVISKYFNEKLAAKGW